MQNCDLWHYERMAATLFFLICSKHFEEKLSLIKDVYSFDNIWKFVTKENIESSIFIIVWNEHFFFLR